MNADEILGSVDEFLGKVRDKVNLSEAKFDMAMDSLEDEDLSETARRANQQERDEEIKKQKQKRPLNK